MRRRRFLTVVGGVGAAAAAGCSAAGGPTVLTSPREEVEPDGETHLHFVDDDRLATMSVRPDTYVADPPYPVDVHVWHRDGTRITDLSLRFRPTAGRPPTPLGDVFVSIPQWTDPPAVSLHSTADGEWRVLEIQRMGELGTGTASVAAQVRPFGDADPRLTVDATIELREDGLLGSTFTLEGRTTVPLRVRS